MTYICLIYNQSSFRFLPHLLHVLLSVVHYYFAPFLLLALVVLAVTRFKVLLLWRDEDVWILYMTIGCSYKKYGGGASFSCSVLIAMSGAGLAVTTIEMLRLEYITMEQERPQE